MTIFHIVEISTTERVSDEVVRTSFEYEITAEDGRPVPHRFPDLNNAEILCGILNQYQADAGRLLGFRPVDLVKGWRSNDIAVAGWRAQGQAVPACIELTDLGSERVVVLRGFSSDLEAEACAENLAVLFP